MATALVHEQLYENRDVSSVEICAYARNLMSHLVASIGGVGLPCTPIISCEPLTLSLDEAIPLGLIMTELITNAIKHASPADSTQRLEITVTIGRSSSCRAPGRSFEC